MTMVFDITKFNCYNKDDRNDSTGPVCNKITNSDNNVTS